MPTKSKPINPALRTTSAQALKRKVRDIRGLISDVPNVKPARGKRARPISEVMDAISDLERSINAAQRNAQKKQSKMKAAADKRAHEAYTGGFNEALGGNDEPPLIASDGLPIGQNYRSARTTLRDESSTSQESAFERSYRQFATNMVAFRVANLHTDYVWSDGITVHCDNDKVDEILAEHMADDVNDWDGKGAQRVRDLFIFGERLDETFVRETDGRVRLGAIDPSSIDQIVTDSENREEIIAVRLKGIAGEQQQAGRLLKVITQDGGQLAGVQQMQYAADQEYQPGALRSIHSKTYRVIEANHPTKHYRSGWSNTKLIETCHGKAWKVSEGQAIRDKRGRLIERRMTEDVNGEPVEGLQYDGQCFLVQSNKVSIGLRGRPSGLSMIDWLDRLDQLFFDILEHAALMKAMAYDHTVDTNDDSKIVKANKAAVTALNRSGGVFTHNKQESLQTVSGDIKGADWSGLYDSLMNFLAAAAGVPVFMLGSAGDANLACYDDKTEVLTLRGWIKHQDLSLDDVVASVDPQTGEMIWTTDWQLHAYPYTGDMIVVEDKHHSLSVTPNHRMLVRYISNWQRTTDKIIKPPENKRPTGWHFILAENLLSGGIKRLRVKQYARATEFTDDVDREFILPGAARSSRPDIPDMPMSWSIWLNFLGWFVSEGGLSHGSKDRMGAHTVYLAQRKPETVPAIREAVMAMPIQFHEHHDSKTGSYRWAVGNKALFDYLVEECGDSASIKHLPEYCLRLGLHESRLLLHAMLLGDGHKRKRHIGDSGWEYSTTSEVLAGQTQALALRCGYAANIKMSNSWRSTHGNRMYVVLIREKKIEVALHNPHFESYSGNVYCLAVSTTAYVTRRNGKVAVQGNTAVAQGGPTYRGFKREQGIIKRYVTRVFQYVIDCAVNAGRLPAEVEVLDNNGKPAIDPETQMPVLIPAREAFEVVMSEISTEDKAAARNTFASLTTAIVALYTTKLLPLKTCIELIAQSALQIGVEIDIDQVTKDLQDAATPNTSGLADALSKIGAGGNGQMPAGGNGQGASDQVQQLLAGMTQDGQPIPALVGA